MCFLPPAYAIEMVARGEVPIRVSADIKWHAILEVNVSQPPPTRGFQSASEQLQPRMNIPAVVSLVLGFVSFCLPILPGLLAVIFGLFGIKRSRDQSVGGRGPAVAGIVLGSLSIMLWLAIMVPFAMTWLQSRPQKALARQFIADLSHQDIDSASKLVATTFGWNHMHDLSDRLNAYGEFKSVNFTGYFYSVVNNTEQWTLTGNAYYAKDYAPFTLITIRQEGQWRVYRLDLSRKVKAIEQESSPSMTPTRPATGP